jgi:hypothetical protein
LLRAGPESIGPGDHEDLVRTVSVDLALTEVVVLDLAVDVEPVVVLDVGPDHCRSAARASRCKVKDGVDVHVAVDGKVRVKVIDEDQVNEDGILARFWCDHDGLTGGRLSPYV